jgi:hypothetical protein
LNCSLEGLIQSLGIFKSNSTKFRNKSPILTSSKIIFHVHKLNFPKALKEID